MYNCVVIMFFYMLTLKLLRCYFFRTKSCFWNNDKMVLKKNIWVKQLKQNSTLMRQRSFT